MENNHLSISVGEAKNRLSNIINEVVFAKKRIIIKSHGKPKAALISADELEKFEEMENELTHSRDRRLRALNRAAQLRKQIFDKNKERLLDSSRDLHQIREKRLDEF